MPVPSSCRLPGAPFQRRGTALGGTSAAATALALLVVGEIRHDHAGMHQRRVRLDALGILVVRMPGLVRRPLDLGQTSASILTLWSSFPACLASSSRDAVTAAHAPCRPAARAPRRSRYSCRRSRVMAWTQAYQVPRGDRRAFAPCQLPFGHA